MEVASRFGSPTITHAVIYTGHQRYPYGPYLESIDIREKMFQRLNQLRVDRGLTPWKVIKVAGECLKQSIEAFDPQKTLLIIPPGEATRLDDVFDREEIRFLKHDFCEQGGRLDFTCGSAYWASKRRLFSFATDGKNKMPQEAVKEGKVSLFQGTAFGPLCRLDGRNGCSFYSEAIRVEGLRGKCVVFSSGGGSFKVQEAMQEGQQVKVLMRYAYDELLRVGKKEEEFRLWEVAAMMVQIGRGSALFSAVHADYDASDLLSEDQAKEFSDLGTNWSEVRKRLSPPLERAQFVLLNLYEPLEKMDFS